MSYQSPNILLLTSPIGIDAVIQSYQQDFYSGLSWLEKSFGRAWEQREKEGSVKVPKAYMGLKEYHSVLPNDFLQAQSFISVQGAEEWPDYPMNGLQRKLSIVFWVNLKEINPDKDYIFTEELRWDVEKIIRANPFTKSLDSYYDEKIEDVFLGYVGSNIGTDGEVNNSQYLMYPYGGFRYDITVGYQEHTDCAPWYSGFSGLVSAVDLELIVGTGSGPIAGSTTFQDNRLIGKKVRLVRGGLHQHTTNVNSNWFWSFNATTGTITVNPAWVNDEQVNIQVYG